MLLCIAGKNDIAVEIARFVLEEYREIQLVGMTTKGDIGADSWQKSYRKFLEDHNIEEIELETAYNREDLIFLSLEYDRIIIPSRFKTNRLFNIHFSLLPKYRGMYTSALPIINNESYTGVTLHYIDQGIDTGDIIAQESIPILFRDTGRDLYFKYISVGIDLVMKYLPAILSCEVLPAQPQDSTKASYYSHGAIDYKNLEIDLNQCAISVYNQLRAYHFREYQIPKVDGVPIVHSFITKQRSYLRPGTLVSLLDGTKRLSTIDFDIILYPDMFQVLLSAIEEENLQLLKSIPHIDFYYQEKDCNGNSIFDLANRKKNEEIIQYLETHSFPKLT